jgi:hypothetical protein
MGRKSRSILLCDQKARKAMRKKTATVAHPSSASPAGRKKPAVAPVVAEPSADGEPVSEEVIRLCAYRKWEAAGRPAGDSVQFWLEAERELAQAK